MGDDSKKVALNSGGKKAAQKIVVKRFTLWLQELSPVFDTALFNRVRQGKTSAKLRESDVPAAAGRIRGRIKARLDSVMGKIAKQAKVPGTSMKVIWTRNISKETVSDCDVAVYFVRNYDGSLITRRTTGAAQETHRKFLSDQSPHGMTLNDTLSFSEVYIDRCVDDAKIDFDDSNVAENLVLDVSFLMANTVIHEAMHNKVDSGEKKRKSNWNLHKDGGGGLAAVPYTVSTEPSTANINLLAKHLRDIHPQYKHV